MFYTLFFLNESSSFSRYFIRSFCVHFCRSGCFLSSDKFATFFVLLFSFVFFFLVDVGCVVCCDYCVFMCGGFFLAIFRCLVMGEVYCF